MPLNGSRKANPRSYLVVIVAAVFLWQQSLPPLLAQATGTQPNSAPELKIVVLEGEDGVNILKKKTAVKPVVEVRDKNNLPVASAYVTFAAPENGARVTFAHGNSTYSTLTDASGRATVHVMKAVGQGAFKIGIKASFQGHIATAAIAQTNYLTAAAATAAGAGASAGGATAGGAAAGGTAAAAGISGTMIGVIAGAVAAGVGVAVAASKAGGGKSSTPPPPPTGTIGAAGTPTIGPPH